jgi:MFS family permease
MKGNAAQRSAALVIAAGIVAAFHIGKRPPAIPVLAQALGTTLLQGGFLLAVVQMAGMCLGAPVGMLADRLGQRRIMLVGLVVLSLSSGLGALAPHATFLLATRVLEGLGFLLAVLPAPALIRRVLLAPPSLNRALGFWGAYMPIGTASILWLGPHAYELVGWRAMWLLLGLGTLVMAGLVWRHVPPDPALDAGPGRASAPAMSMGQRLGATLRASGPWAVALAFLMYSGQWLAVVGFLPTIYTEAGWSAAQVGALSALAAGVNLIGNIAAGRLLARGVQPRTLLWLGYGSMGLGAWVAFASGAAPWLQYLAVLGFSAIGGLIPGTLFTLAVRLAPGPETVSTTVGWVQQLSSLGQFVGPPFVAWLALRAGGWHLTWWVNAACCVVGGGLAVVLQRRLPRT